MSDYIKREDAIEAIRRSPITNMGTKLFCYDEIGDIPSADVVERKTGKWRENGEPNAYGKFELWYYDCSLCGAVGIQQYNFCPNCGARMVKDDV